MVGQRRCRSVPQGIRGSGRGLPVTSRAYILGRGAAAAGADYNTNPYTRGSRDHLDWSIGHNEVRASRIRRRK